MQKYTNLILDSFLSSRFPSKNRNFEDVMKCTKLQRWGYSLVNFFFPRYCPVCGELLLHPHAVLCPHCDFGMPRTNHHLQRDNEIEKMFWGKIPLLRATSYFYYTRGGVYNRIIHQFKYYGNKQLARRIGGMAAQELLSSGFFEGIDFLVPVPLHPKREKQRGYNQSEWLAQGIADVTGIPVNTHLVARKTETSTQTRKSVYERWTNMQEVFTLTAAPSTLRNKHLLLIDDVLTTGATLTACAEVFLSVEGIQFSIFTLGQAQQ